ncbi:hypothetical protein VTK26DRAFT_2704 [Humicola hyalothermophila]
MKLSISSALFIAGWFRTAAADIPAVCYSTCNNAYLEGQRVGWGDWLCEPGGSFMSFKLSCYGCCENHWFEGGLMDLGLLQEKGCYGAVSPTSAAVPVVDLDPDLLFSLHLVVELSRMEIKVSPIEGFLYCGHNYTQPARGNGVGLAGVQLRYC